jgi:hypothetical protein
MQEIMRAREDIRMLNEIRLASKRSHDGAMRRQVNVQKELDDVQQAMGAAEARRDRLEKEISRYVSERMPSRIVCQVDTVVLFLKNSKNFRHVEKCIHNSFGEKITQT